MKTKKRIPVPLGAAMLLLCLVLVTAHFSTGMLARYVTRTSGGDSGHVASFKVTATADETEPLSVAFLGEDDDGKADYEIKISNPSVIAVRYEAVVSFAEGEKILPTVSFKEDDKEDDGKIDKAEGSDLKFEGNLAPGDEKTITVTFDLNKELTSSYSDQGLDFENNETSEETGTISVAENGHIMRHLSPEYLKEVLMPAFEVPTTGIKDMVMNWRTKK